MNVVNGKQEMKCIWAGLALLLAGNAVADSEFDPFYTRLSETNGASLLAIRPFYSHAADPASERWRTDWLWPLYTHKGFQDERYSRLLFFGYANDFSEHDDRRRAWLLPFYFEGVDRDGKDYLAIFPLGGSIHEFLGRDEIHFVLFPLYARSQVNEVQTTSVLWPIYSRTEGDRVERFRIWPFYGRSELEGEFCKKFYGWPIYHTVEYTNERNPGGGFMLFPFYGKVKTEQAENTWVLPPFFRVATSEQQKIIHAPWPFIQLADGAIHKRMYWPLYGKKQQGPLLKQFWLWPIFWNNRTDYADHVLQRRMGIPFFYHETTTAGPTHADFAEGEVYSHYWKLWPLASRVRQGEDSRFRLLDLWPLRDTPGVERNWAPFWTLYSRTRAENKTHHHLLWILYDQQRDADQFEWSLLKGVAGYKKTDAGRQFRILFKWFGGEDQP